MKASDVAKIPLTLTEVENIIYHNVLEEIAKAQRAGESKLETRNLVNHKPILIKLEKDGFMIENTYSHIHDTGGNNILWGKSKRNILIIAWAFKIFFIGIVSFIFYSLLFL